MDAQQAISKTILGSLPGEQIDIYRPGAKMASSHVKQRLSLRLPALITNTNTKKTHDVFFFSYLPLSLPLWLLLWHGATVDVGLPLTAPTHKAADLFLAVLGLCRENSAWRNLGFDSEDCSSGHGIVSGASFGRHAKQTLCSWLHVKEQEVSVYRLLFEN